MYGDIISVLLEEQYRSNKLIMGFSSKMLYDDKIRANKSNESCSLSDLEGAKTTPETISPLIYIDTRGNKKYFEDGSLKSKHPTSISIKSDTRSKFNNGEVKLVLDHLNKLTAAGIRCQDIAIISPYNKQVNTIKKKVNYTFKSVEVGSVDSFQGREKEAVIMSLVRSNHEGQVGFLNDFRRINVGMTRAKKHLCVIANSSTLSKGGSFLGKFCKYLLKYGVTRSPK
ncbi:DNA polymerase alpha-associated DNA helicase A [Smittium mucronatum]|uniref:DNA polymerase alpha-associated DNA helicase A n=1 Tax=Smittium mucronatum TaxID=133383 RepID=A0A1R0GL85_9FUNG|nr:DNA polymerase alpha-associated DNA helicase A [Smittium mucronatum]